MEIQCAKKLHISRALRAINVLRGRPRASRNYVFFLKNCESIVSQGVVYTVFSSCMWSSHVTGFSVDPPLTAHRLQVYV